MSMYIYENGINLKSLKLLCIIAYWYKYRTITNYLNYKKSVYFSFTDTNIKRCCQNKLNEFPCCFHVVSCLYL
jgi:hypothetical protein